MAPAPTSAKATSNDPNGTESKTPANEPRYLWVINNMDHAHTISLTPRPQPGSKTLSAPDMMTLYPGATVVDRGFWIKWKEQQSAGENNEDEAARLLTDKIPRDDHPHRRSERAGQVYVVEGPAVRDRTMPFADLDQAAAIAMVPEIRDERILKRLLEVERRPAVVETLRLEANKLARAMVAPTGI